jgi:hypothetical protein
MKKKNLFFGMPAIVLAFGMTVTGCGDTGNTDAESFTCTSADASGNTYTLTVTPKADKAAYAAKIGDSYVLTIRSSSGQTKISRGTVQSIENGSYLTLTLKPSNTATTFTIMIIDGTMLVIRGTITHEDGTTVSAPTLVQGGGNTDPKSITITGLSGQTGQITVALSYQQLTIVNGKWHGDTANGTGTISSDTVTVSLKKDDDSVWTGSGYCLLGINIGEAPFLYTNGNSGVQWALIRITGATTTVAFNKFSDGTH